MATDRTRDCLAALEHARAQIESVLAGDADWPALRRAVPGSSPLAQELAFAANPLYRSWKHLNEAIGDLQAALPEDGREAAGPAPAPGEAHRPVRAEARSIALHHILRHIRDSAGEAGDRDATGRAAPHEAPASLATATDDARGPGVAGAAHLQPEARQVEAGDGAVGGEPMYHAQVFAAEHEEASVTFVIRDEAAAVSAEGDPAQGEVEGGLLTEQWAAAGAEDGLYAPTGGEVEEAEVVIVSRRAERRRSRRA